MPMDPMEVFLGALGHQTQMVQQLRAAADQQSRLADIRRQQDFENEQQGFRNQMSILGAGGTAVGPDNTTPGSTLAPNPIGFTKGQPQNVTQPTRVPVRDPGRVVQAPQGGGRYYIPNQRDKDEEDLRKKVAEAQATGGEDTSWTLPDAFAAKLGLPPGSKVPHEAVSEAFKRATAPQEKEKPENLTEEELTMRATKGDKTAQQVLDAMQKRKVAIAHESRPPEKPDKPAKPAQATPGERSAASKDYGDALHRAENVYSNAVKDSVKKPDKERTQLLATARDRLWKSKQDAQNTYRARMKELGVEVPEQDYVTQRAAMEGGGAAASPQAAAQASAAPKQATLANVREFAKKNNISEAQAIRQAKAEGYQIAGQ